MILLISADPKLIGESPFIAAEVPAFDWCGDTICILFVLKLRRN